MNSNVEIIMDERKNILEQINSIRAVNVQIIAVGITAVSAIFSYTLIKNEFVLLIILPYFLFGVLFYNLLLLSSIYALVGYLQYLEEKLNKIEGLDCIKWSVMAQRHIKAKTINYAIYFLFCLAFIASIGITISTYKSFSSIFQKALIVSYCLWFILFILSIISFLKTKNLDKSVYKYFTTLKQNKQ